MRRSPSHSDTVSACGPAPDARRQIALKRRLEPGVLHPVTDLRRREAEPVVGMLLAQELEVVRGEVDDQQPAAGREHARRLPDGERRIRQEVQHLMHDDGVGDAVRQAEGVDIAMAHLRARQLRLRQVAAGVGKHRVAEVEADAALVAVGEQLEDAPGAGAEIDQQLERTVPQRLDDGLLDVVLGDMQGANAVPVGGVRLEIGLRRGFALALQGVGALTVAGDDAVGAVDKVEDVERQPAAGRAVGRRGSRPSCPRGSVRPARPRPAASNDG